MALPQFLGLWRGYGVALDNGGQSPIFRDCCSFAWGFVVTFLRLAFLLRSTHG